MSITAIVFYVTDTFDGTHAIALNEITGLYTGTEAENTVLASVKTITGYLLQLMEKVRCTISVTSWIKKIIRMTLIILLTGI